MGWGNFLSGLIDKIPIQGRIERWKNKLEELEREKSDILIHKWSEEQACRLDIIERDIAKLHRLLKNRAK